MRNLPEAEECFNQLPLAAHGHPGKTLEPSAVRHLGILIEPAPEGFQLITTNFAMFYSISRCRSSAKGRPSRRTLGIDLHSVETVHQGFLQLRDFCSIARLRQPFAQLAQLLRTQPRHGLVFTRKLHYLDALFRRQFLDRFDDLRGAHDGKVI